MFQFLLDLFDLPRKLRRNRLKRKPLSPALLQVLQDTVRPFSNWDEPRQQRLIDAVKILNGEKVWEGCDDLVLTEEIKTAISGQAAIMLMGVEDYYFDGLHTILVFPETYEREMQDGLLVSEQSVAGQAWSDGRISLAWSDVIHGFEQPHDGHNVVIHEFAHHLDTISGGFDGQPNMQRGSDQRLWRQVSQREYQRLVEAVNEWKPTLLDPYGATNPAEFFAVASETFFEQARQLEAEHAELFALLKKLYRVDPGEWD